MNRKKKCGRLLALLLVAVMCLSVPAVAMAADGEAEFDGTTYASVQDAVDAAANAGGGTVTLLGNATESIAIPAGSSITLDLGGFTLANESGEDTISNRGALTIQGTGVVENTSSGCGALVNYPGATAVLNGGTFTANQWYTIKNLGDMRIGDGVTVTTGTSGSSLIDNGWYGNAGNDRQTTYQGTTAKLTITGGRLSGGMNTVKNDDGGELIITGGTFENTTGPVVLNWNIAEISGGTFTTSSAIVLANGYLDDEKDKGQLTITGGTFISGNDGPLFTFPLGSGNGGRISISNASFDGLVNTDVGGAALTYDVEIQSGTFTSAVPAAYVAAGQTSASLTSGEETAYYVGSAQQIAEILEESAEQGDAIAIYQGDAALQLAEGVRVTNSGTGAVVVNGENVGQDEEVVSHVHQATAVEEKAATCTEDGHSAYWHCPECGRYFSDADLTEEISLADTVLEATGHTFSEEWKSNETNHWHVCENCDARADEAPHTFGNWVVTKQAGETEEGSRTRACTACGYSQTEAIAATGSTDTDAEEPAPTVPAEEPEATAPASTADQESSGNAPKTGDESSAALWVILLVAAAAGIGVAVYAGVRRKRASS